MPSELVKELDHLFANRRSYANRWLGVDQIGFGKQYAKYGNDKLPSGYPHIKDVVHRSAAAFRAIAQQQPNTLYIQRQVPGQKVNRHRDPLNNLIGTTIYYAGDWVGGELVVEDVAPLIITGSSVHIKDNQYWLKPSEGTLVYLPCTVDGRQGPWHWTTPIKSGTRYTLIFNIINYESHHSGH